MAPAVCFFSRMKLHVAMGYHPPFLCQESVDRLVDPAQCGRGLPQVRGPDMPLMGQHSQLVQVPPPGPQFAQERLQVLHHKDRRFQGGVEQIFLLA